MAKKLVVGMAVVAVLLVVPLALRGPAVVAADETRVDRLIQVSGTGEVKVGPDVATVQVAVETTAETAKAAQEQNARAMQGVIDTLRKLGIAEKDIRTTQPRNYPCIPCTSPRSACGRRRSRNLPAWWASGPRTACR